MKGHSFLSKTISALFIAVTLLGCFAVFAFADKEVTPTDAAATAANDPVTATDAEATATDCKTEEDDLLYMYYGKSEDGKHSVMRIGFQEEYVKFADNFKIEVKCYDPEKTEEDEDYGFSKTFDSSEMDYIIENTEDSEFPQAAIYIFDKEIDTPSGVIIEENTVFDANGNGNKRIEEYGVNDFPFYFKLDSYYLDSDSLVCNVGDRLWGWTGFPADYYMNDELLGENMEKLDYEVKETGELKFTIKKFGKVIYSRDYKAKNHTFADNLALSGEMLKEAGLALVGFPVLLLSAPIAGLIFPPLGIAALFTPLLGIRMSLSGFIQAIALLFV